MSTIATRAHARALRANPLLPRRIGRTLAQLSLLCTAIHIPLVITHVTAAPLFALAMTVVSAACIPCAIKLWRSPTVYDSIAAASLAAVMVGLHMILIMSMSTPVHPADMVMPASTPAHHSISDTTAPDDTMASMPATSSEPAAQPMVMNPALETLLYLATALTALQIIINSGAVIAAISRHGSTLTAINPDSPMTSAQPRWDRRRPTTGTAGSPDRSPQTY
ncbi:hypothetical protein [Mycolicibacterium llatzerense]|uniref:hypothetical protein n=1 Tax=Mycolicibacterium llatzerense TaxID=280871 RepID=UPI0013A704EB|nr:hypothetical protein [Mycolicibacterium llatzerense]